MKRTINIYKATFPQPEILDQPETLGELYGQWWTDASGCEDAIDAFVEDDDEPRPVVKAVSVDVVWLGAEDDNGSTLVKTRIESDAFYGSTTWSLVYEPQNDAWAGMGDSPDLWVDADLARSLGTDVAVAIGKVVCAMARRALA